MLSDSYGIVWSKDAMLSLTVVGRRVYLHMLDAMKFVDDVSAATAKFQES
jgi:phage-related protein